MPAPATEVEQRSGTGLLYDMATVELRFFCILFRQADDWPEPEEIVIEAPFVFFSQGSHQP